MGYSALLSVIAVAAAFPAIAAERHLAVTIYPGNGALVEDTRTLDFAAGRSVVAFPDVSANIRPETASLAADGVSIVEQNFDFDLLTPQKLMEKALGLPIKIVRTNPGTGAQVTEEATVLSTQQGVVLKVGDHIEVLRDDGIPTRVLFDKVPDTLKAQPTLSVLVSSSRAGARPATLRYMTSGLGWKADYIANYDEKNATLDLQGWVTLTNTTNVAYDDAKVTVAAGALGSGTQGAGGQNDALAMFDLPERVTIADRQAKQVGMVTLKGVPAEKVYHYTAGPFFAGTANQPVKADVMLRFAATDGSGTNWRLPRGAFRAFIKDAKGDAQFAGETQIADIMPGAKIEAAISKAFDIDIKPRLVREERFGQVGQRRSMEYTVSNASAVPVAVEIEQDNYGSSVRITEESQPDRALDAHRHLWVVAVPAHGEAVLTDTSEQGQ
jgi:hypothetical protein